MTATTIAQVATAAFLLLRGALAPAQDVTVEPIGALNGEAPLAEALLTTGWRVTRADGNAAAAFWSARSIERLDDGVFVGAVRLTAEAQDVRGRSIPRGVYTLRLARISDGDGHARCMGYPDFLLLLRAADDPDATARLSYHEIATRSAAIVRGRHPVVWQAQRGSARRGNPTFNVDARGNEVLTVPLDVKGGPLALSIFLRGSLSR